MRHLVLLLLLALATFSCSKTPAPQKRDKPALPAYQPPKADWPGLVELVSQSPAAQQIGVNSLYTGGINRATALGRDFAKSHAALARESHGQAGLLAGQVERTELLAVQGVKAAKALLKALSVRPTGGYAHVLAMRLKPLARWFCLAVTLRAARAKTITGLRETLAELGRVTGLPPEFDLTQSLLLVRIMNQLTLYGKSWRRTAGAVLPQMLALSAASSLPEARVMWFENPEIFRAAEALERVVTGLGHALDGYYYHLALAANNAVALQNHGLMMVDTALTQLDAKLKLLRENLKHLAARDRKKNLQAPMIPTMRRAINQLVAFRHRLSKSRAGVKKPLPLKLSFLLNRAGFPGLRAIDPMLNPLAPAGLGSLFSRTWSKARKAMREAARATGQAAGVVAGKAKAGLTLLRSKANNMVRRAEALIGRGKALIMKGAKKAGQRILDSARQFKEKARKALLSLPGLAWKGVEAAGGAVKFGAKSVLALTDAASQVLSNKAMETYYGVEMTPMWKTLDQVYNVPPDKLGEQAAQTARRSFDTLDQNLGVSGQVALDVATLGGYGLAKDSITLLRNDATSLEKGLATVGIGLSLFGALPGNATKKILKHGGKMSLQTVNSGLRAALKALKSQGLKGGMQTIVKGLKGGGKWTVEALRGLLRSGGARFNDIRLALSGPLARELLQKTRAGLKPLSKELLNRAGPALKKLLGGAGKGLVSILKGTGKGLAGLGTGAMSLMGKLKDMVKNNWRSAWDTTRNGLAKGLKNAGKLLNDVGSGLWETLTLSGIRDKLLTKVGFKQVMREYFGINGLKLIKLAGKFPFLIPKLKLNGVLDILARGLDTVAANKLKKLLGDALTEEGGGTLLPARPDRNKEKAEEERRNKEKRAEEQEKPGPGQAPAGAIAAVGGKEPAGALARELNQAEQGLANLEKEARQEPGKKPGQQPGKTTKPGPGVPKGSPGRTKRLTAAELKKMKQAAYRDGLYVGRSVRAGHPNHRALVRSYYKKYQWHKALKEAFKAGWRRGSAR